MGDTYTVSKEEKKAWECMTHDLNKLAALWAGGAAVMAGVGAIPTAVIAGVASAAFWYLGDVASDVADDPPQPNFRKKVKIEAIRARLPRGTSAGAKAFNKATKLTIKAIPYANGLLQSLERYQGAKKAKNEPYTNMHAATIRQMKKKSVKTLADLSNTLASLAGEIKGTDADIKVTHKNLKDFQAQVRKKGLPAEWKKALGKAGFSSKQISEYKKWLVEYYVKQLWTTTLSYQAKVTANILKKENKKLVKHSK